MKSISNLSHAKAVHAVKSIGKVLLPVALLLAAILCIGVAAGAADKTYTHVPNTDLHVESDGTTSDLKPCEFKGAACATVWKCVCGNTKAHTPDESKHVKAYVVSAEYVQKAGKCLNESTLYTSCKNCGKVLTDTFVPKNVTIVKNEGHVFDQTTPDAKYLVTEHECNTLKAYYKYCKCGVSSKGITNETFNDKTAVWPHNPVHYNGETDADFKAKGWTLKVADLAVNVHACNGSGTYWDYCKDCGTVIKDSTSDYAGGTGHTWVVYKNESVHWKACKFCGEVDGIFEGHVYDANAVPTCQASVNCSVCGYAVKAKAAHKLESVAAKAATCNTDGNVAYNKCSVCGKMFDAAGTEIKAGAEVLPATGHTRDPQNPLCNPGKCTVCDDDITPLKGHNYAPTESNYVVVDGKLTNTLLCTAKCADCGAQADAKGHSYEEKIISLPTCTENGRKIVICSKCGDIKEEKITLATGHKLDAVVNCYQSAKCNVCGTVVSGYHTMPEALRSAIENGTLRCTDSYKCAICGIELVGNTQHKIENVAAVAATCTADGITAGWKCTDKVVINGLEYACNMHYGAEKVEKTGHKYGDWKVTVEATCMNTGKKTRTCSVCGATEDATIDKSTTHKLSENYKFSADKHWKYCTVAGCTYIEGLEDHDMDPAKPTCTKDSVCKDCGYTVKATGHKNIVWNSDATKHWKECKDCDYKVPGSEAAHAINIFKSKLDVNYCKDGYEEHYACECGYAPEKTVIKADPDNHKWGEWKYASKSNSTTNSGTAKNSYHYRKCEVCGKIDSHKGALKSGTQTCLTAGTCKTCDLKLLKANGSDNNPAKDHKFGQLVNVDGHTFTATCTACRLEVKTIKHTINENDPACIDRKCTFEGCDYVVKASADHVPNTDQEPVMNASGHGFTCKNCDQKIANEPHKADAVVDCTEDLVCKICGYVMAPGKENHDWVLVPGTPASCTAEGTTEHFKCKNCTVETTYDVIAKTEHKWVEKEGKPATTTETGYTAYKECSVCGEKVGYQEIPKLAVVRGDFNNDGKVNKDDAIYLLKSVLLGTTDYPINQSADVDGNGKANKDDAIYLLKNVLLGDALYPLK